MPGRHTYAPDKNCPHCKGTGVKSVPYKNADGKITRLHERCVCTGKKAGRR